VEKSEGERGWMIKRKDWRQGKVLRMCTRKGKVVVIAVILTKQPNIELKVAILTRTRESNELQIAK
jgi:hypothetical protein